MSTPTTPTTTPAGTSYQDAARDHLWMHFTRHSVFEDGGRVPIIVRGEGHRIWDDGGKEYIDGLAGLFVVNVGHGRAEIAEAMAAQAKQLEFFPLWSYAHPRAIELAERLAANAPGDLNRVFFTTGGGEAVETAWKLAKQYFKLTGKPTKTKVISRAIAYHGTPHGALSLTGITPARVPFEPLVPGAFKVPNTNIYRGPEHLREDEKAFGRWAADRIEEAILFEGPESVAAVFLEPVQNSGGCFPPPAGYFERVREICEYGDPARLRRDDLRLRPDRLDVRVRRLRLCPRHHHDGQGIASGYAPLGLMIASERIFEPFKQGTNFFPTATPGRSPGLRGGRDGQPDIFEREGLNAHVKENAPAFRHTLSACSTCRSSATSAALATSTASRWSRTRPPARPSTPRSPNGCCAASSPRPSSTPASTAAPTTAATPSSSSLPR